MTDIKSRLVDGMRGQGIRLPDGDWLRLDDNNLGLIAERLLRTAELATVDAELASDASIAIADWINGAPCDDPAYARSMVDRLADIAAAAAP